MFRRLEEYKRTVGANYFRNYNCNGQGSYRSNKAQGSKQIIKNLK